VRIEAGVMIGPRPERLPLRLPAPPGGILIHLNTYALIRLQKYYLVCRETMSPEPGLDRQKFLLLEAGLQRNYFFRARTGSAEISASRSRAAEIFFSEPGLDRQKFLLLEAGLQRNYFARVAGTGFAEMRRIWGPVRMNKPVR
jgi:hypothetical protein